jgi:DnaJ homolog subfamily C member 7
MEKFDESIADFKSAIQQGNKEGSDADVRALRAELKKAEAALKRSKTKDYYKILGECHCCPRSSSFCDNKKFSGVPRDCSEIDIKKAYRKESLKHHPDKVTTYYISPAYRIHLFCA